MAYSCSSNKPLERQLLQQRLRLLQIARVEPFRKPAVNRSKQFVRLLHLTLVAPAACEAHGGAEFPRFGLLLAGDGERSAEISFQGSLPVRYAECRDPVFGKRSLGKKQRARKLAGIAETWRAPPSRQKHHQ